MNQSEELPKSPDEIAWLLNFFMKVDMFSALNPEELYELIRHARKFHFRKGDVVVEQGTAGDSFFIIYKGKTKAVFTKSASIKVELGMLGPEQFFGEMALILDQPRSATVSAEEETDCFALFKTDFQHLVRKNPLFAKIVKTATLQRASEINRKS